MQISGAVARGPAPPSAFDALSRATARLTAAEGYRETESALIDQTCESTRSDLVAFYLPGGGPSGPFRLSASRGAFAPPARLERTDEATAFLLECGEPAVLNGRRPCFLEGLLLHPAMESAAATPLATPQGTIGLLVANSLERGHFGRDGLNFLENFAALAAGVLRNARLHAELKERAAEIESLQRYQESVFESMTNYLVATEADGSLRYCNAGAAEAFGFSERDRGRPVADLLGPILSPEALAAVRDSIADGSTILGLEGIAKGAGREIDFSLNLSPIRRRRSARSDGHVLVFTDQSRERELKEKVAVVVEERRVVKDMFSRYLSEEVVSHLMATPALAGLGGSGKRATVFFADIRGYTSFSEGKRPEYVVEVLNEYFSEAVEVVARRRGFIDKFIGDCIMAAWGVPLASESEDARNAVACAIEIQRLVADPGRKFFRGEAAGLKVGIGVHTGYLVAGNLGSPRRMNYSVIGDTVNVAARLEGVAGPGEVIVTGETRALLGDAFAIEERESVRVKGKRDPIRIFRAVDFADPADRRTP